MKWQWFNKDRLGVGFILGILLVLLGIWMFALYVNEAVGQYGAEILVFTGSILIIGGLINNVVVAIYWLRRLGRRETGRIDTRD